MGNKQSNELAERIDTMLDFLAKGTSSGVIRWSWKSPYNATAELGTAGRISVSWLWADAQDVEDDAAYHGTVTIQGRSGVVTKTDASEELIRALIDRYNCAVESLVARILEDLQRRG